MNKEQITEHEKLKWICNKIGYSYENTKLESGHDIYEGTECSINVKLDVREIIFTQEFINTFWEYKEQWGFSKRFFNNELMEHLDNPIEYIYNLIK